MKKILVTGGAGFVGAHLCRFLLEQGDEVVCVDNLHTGHRENIRDLESDSRFRFLERDVSMPYSINGLDRIYNLACPASPPQYQRDPVFTWKTSVYGMHHALELARACGNIPVLQASTSEVYGDPQVHPQSESYRGHVNPIGLRACYDEGKRAAETLCFDYKRKYGTPVRVARIFNTYGPGMDPEDGRVVSNFIVQALKNEPITIYGDGSQTRSFQYIDDLIRGLVAFMENKMEHAGPVNLGNPAEFTIGELAALVLKLIPESKSVLHYKPLPEDDPLKRRPDIRLARELLHWEPRVSLREGLAPTILYFRSLS